jgi:hypothetical protein
VTFTKVLTIYHVKFTPSIILLYPLTPIPGIVQTDLVFPFTCMCTPYSPSYILSPHPPHSHWYQPPERICSALLFSASVF